ncbi:CLUMA_CG016907, isoform A [Clunio marinus]|uniref:CLUMA_CG016907, isoform A n=1 Tax=Clunio marinus TaxID=568069 RepID=A0A1J1IUV7_9DIPT|nr:CLUMA_CG016907, isoform A [Clunio marinus]
MDKRGNEVTECEHETITINMMKMKFMFICDQDMNGISYEIFKYKRSFIDSTSKKRLKPLACLPLTLRLGE